MPRRYDWDEVKAEANARAHGITFAEAEDAASDPLAIDELDLAHSDGEERVKVVGWSPSGVVLVVIVSMSGTKPRIISARRATKRERDAYTR
jgi:uncharacterized DUF497 family protein